MWRVVVSYLQDLFKTTGMFGYEGRVSLSLITATFRDNQIMGWIPIRGQLGNAVDPRQSFLIFAEAQKQTNVL